MKNSENFIFEINSLVDKFLDENKPVDGFKPGITSIPPSGKVIGSSEIKLMIESCLDGWLTCGRFNDNFESKLAEFLGVRKLITVNSGSSANLVAFSTLTSPKLGDRRIKKNDEVITVAAGFPTTVNPIIQFGAIPVFVDVELNSGNIDVDLIESAITSKTKAVMIAHCLGNPFNLSEVVRICKKYNLWLIEDCCDALGSVYGDKQVGTYGDISTLSFYPAHHITMGEGGAVFSNNIELLKIAESFRDWGRDCYCPPGRDNTCNKRFCWTSKELGGGLPDGYDHKYTYSHLGYNLKITDMQAACGLAQLNKLNEFIETRRDNHKYLYNSLKKYSDYFILPEPSSNTNPSWFGFMLVVKEESGLVRNELIEFLNFYNIGTRLLFAGNLTKQPYMENQNFRIHGDLKNTNNIMKNAFWIGVFPGLGVSELDYVIQKFEEFLS